MRRIHFSCSLYYHHVKYVISSLSLRHKLIAWSKIRRSLMLLQSTFKDLFSSQLNMDLYFSALLISKMRCFELWDGLLWSCCTFGTDLGSLQFRLGFWGKIHPDFTRTGTAAAILHQSQSDLSSGTSWRGLLTLGLRGGQQTKGCPHYFGGFFGFFLSLRPLPHPSLWKLLLSKLAVTSSWQTDGLKSISFHKFGIRW